MTNSRVSLFLALLAAPAVSAAAAAADIPGGPGTGARVVVGGAAVGSELGSATDADWFRASLQAGKLYAFTYRTGSFVGRDGLRFRFTARGAGGRVLAAADQQAGGEFDLTTQLNFRPKTAGTYYFEVKLAPGQPPGFELPVVYEVGLSRDVSSSFEDAARLPFGQEVAGKLQTADDVDYFVVRLEKGKPVDLVAPGGGPFDHVVLYDRNRRRVGEVDLDFGKLAYYRPTYTGEHFISVESISETYDYTLKVAPADRGRPTPGNDLLIGTAGPDRIDALDGADQVRGLAGDDVLRGGAGEDTIFGGPGNDKVKGAEGIDHLFGEAGDDALTGGPDADDLHGGPGDDRFLFFGDAARGYDSGSRANPDPFLQGLDRIDDFAPGDKVDLRGIDADATRPGRQPFTFVGTAPFSAPGQVRYGLETGDPAFPRTVITLNTDADPAPEVEILLEKRIALRAADLILRDPPRRR